jgi:hypothetical protein
MSESEESVKNVDKNQDISPKERLKRMNVLSKLFKQADTPERTTRFIYVDNLEIKNRNRIERTRKTVNGTFVCLKNQTRVTTIEKEYGVKRANMFFFEDSQLKATSIISIMKDKKWLEDDTSDADEETMSVYTEVLTEMGGKSLKDILKISSREKNVDKIKFILENRDKLEWFDKQLQE